MIENIFYDIDEIIVEIRNIQDGQTLGTGFVITDDGKIATCYHVVGKRYEKEITNLSVKLRFSETEMDGTVIEEYCDAVNDIAIIKLNGEIPQGAKVANLARLRNRYVGNKFESRGYRNRYQFEEALDSNGTIRKFTKFKDEDGTREVIQLLSENLAEEGMSGAPILDKETGLVVGMMSFYSTLKGGVDFNKPFAVPVELFLKKFQDLTEQNLGIKILEFLKRINKVEKIYLAMDDLFVAPKEYDKIKKILEDEKIIFIVGSPEYGKTYTAIHILLEYFRKKDSNYELIRMTFPENRNDGETIEELNKIIIALKNKEILLYLQDPFGETKLIEPSEEFSKKLFELISSFKTQSKSRLIITSRSDLFKSVEDRIMGEAKGVTTYLNLKTGSYDYERRKKILLNLSKFYECQWLENIESKNQILNWIKDSRILPSLLNMMNYALSTRRVRDIDELGRKIDIHSQSTPRWFADEIKLKSPEYMLFLSFPFIGDFEKDFVIKNYNKLLKDLDNLHDFEFEKVQEKFEEVVNVDDNVSFYHPSYFEALPYLFEDKNSGNPHTEIKNNFYKVLKTISESELAFECVIPIVENYKNLPREGQILLFDLAKKYDSLPSLTSIISNNPDSLPISIIPRLLETRLKFGNNSQGDGWIIEPYFDKFPNDVKLTLLRTLSNYKDTGYQIIKHVCDHYNELPEEAKQMLFDLYEDKKYYQSIANHVARNYLKLPEEVRRLLIETTDYLYSYPEQHIDNIPYFLESIADNFKNLPREVQDILRNVPRKNTFGGHFAFDIARNFHDLPKEVQNILFELAEDDNMFLYSALIQHYTNLPESIHDFMFDLAKKEKHQEYFFSSLIEYFDYIPTEGALKLLFVLTENVKNVDEVAGVLSQCYPQIPKKEAIELLNKITTKVEGKCSNLLSCIGSNFSEMPENFKNFFRSAAFDEENAKFVAREIIINYHNLPEEERNLLLKITYNEKTAFYIASWINYFENIPEKVRDYLLPILSSSHQAAREIIFYITRNFEELSKQNQDILLDLSKKEENIKHVVDAIVSNFDELPRDIRNDLLRYSAENNPKLEKYEELLDQHGNKIPNDLKLLLSK